MMYIFGRAGRQNVPTQNSSKPAFNRNTLIVLVAAIAVVFAYSVRTARAQARDMQRANFTPILLELFTSEGCSSCPPADALVLQWDSKQPVSDAELIVLSEHVDYWNHDGWKDPYSSSALTERQIDYVRALKLKEPYTPQLIMDGDTVLQGSEAQMIQELQKDAGAPKLSLHIESVSDQAPQDIRGHVDVSGAPEKHGADVYVALALNRAESQVSAGENSGRHLSHVAVVEEIKKVGKLNKDSKFSQDFELKLRPGVDSNNVRVVAFVQEPGPGRVLGAAMWKAGN